MLVERRSRKPRVCQFTTEIISGAGFTCHRVRGITRLEDEMCLVIILLISATKVLCHSGPGNLSQKTRLLFFCQSSLCSRKDAVFSRTQTKFGGKGDSEVRGCLRKCQGGTKCRERRPGKRRDEARKAAAEKAAAKPSSGLLCCRRPDHSQPAGPWFLCTPDLICTAA